MIDYYNVTPRNQYHSTREILLLPPVQFGNMTNYKTRTVPYFANTIRCNLTLNLRKDFFDTKPLICGIPCHLILKNFIHLEIVMAVRKAIFVNYVIQCYLCTCMCGWCNVCYCLALCLSCLLLYAYTVVSCCFCITPTRRNSIVPIVVSIK